MLKNNCDNQSSFAELLQRDSSVSIHVNIQILAKEMHKVSKGLSPPQIPNYFDKEMNLII